MIFKYNTLLNILHVSSSICVIQTSTARGDWFILKAPLMTILNIDGVLINIYIKTNALRNQAFMLIPIYDIQDKGIMLTGKSGNILRRKSTKQTQRKSPKL